MNLRVLAMVVIVVVALAAWLVSSRDAPPASGSAAAPGTHATSTDPSRTTPLDVPLEVTKKPATTGFSAASSIDAPRTASTATPRTFRLAVFEGDDPADFFGARVFEYPSGRDLQFVGPELRASHLLELVVPDVRFMVRALADCCDTKDEGPFDPATMPGTIETRLTPSPGFAGVVLAGSAPLDGVEVSVVSASAWRDALRARREPDPRWSTQTLRGGRFHVRVRDRGFYALRVAREGYATLETGPFGLDGKTRHDDLELMLGRGGRIDGLVVDVDRVAIAGREVVLTTGIARVLRLETDEAGRFTCDALAPGTWYVGARVEDGTHLVDEHALSSGATTNVDGEPRYELASRVEVAEGGTSRVELVLSRLATLDVELAPPLGAYGMWTMRAECAASSSADFEHAGARVMALPEADPSSIALEPFPDSERGLRQRLARLLPGICTLTASTMGEDEQRQGWIDAFVVAPIEVGEDVRTWTFAPEFGALEVELDPPAREPVEVSLLWTGTKGQYFGASALVGRGGSASFRAVPAGPCNVRLEGTEPRSSSANVAPGITVHVRL